MLMAMGCNFGRSTSLPDAGASFEAGSMDFDGSVSGVDAGVEAGGPKRDAATEAATAFSIGGHVTGLSGAGLVLRDNGGDDLAITGDGAFTFKTDIAPGGSYAVSVSAQPSHPTQVCAVTAGTGIATADVSGIQITCATDEYTVGGTLVGLDAASTGGVVLADALGAGSIDEVTVNQNGSFTFPTKVASGSSFAVSVQTNPISPAQTCIVSGGTGTIVAGAVTSVVVNCATNAYVLGGTVSGLDGQGLVLQTSSTTVAVSSNGTFAFPVAIASGTPYTVTVQTQPRGPSQACSVTGGTGTMGSTNVTSVSVACVTDTFTVGGTVSGLSGGGLVLQDSAGDSLPVTASGAFVFPTAVASGAQYAVTAPTQPTSPWLTCTVTGGAGTVGDGPVTTVEVACVSNTYPVSVTASGVAGAGLTVTLDSVSPLTLPSDGTYTFSANVISGATYAVAISAQPTNPTQTCTVADGTGTVAGGPITSVTVACTTQAYPVGGTVSGLLGTGLVLTNNGGDKVTVAPGATSVTFATPVASGGAYDVEIATQPSNPSQTCSVSGNKGTIVSGGVNSVVVNCGTNTFTVGGTVSGLTGKGLVLQDGTATVAVTAQGSFAFPPTASGSAYDVTVAMQPTAPSQICTVAGGTGTVGGTNLTSVVVACVTQSFTVGGVVNALAGGGFVLEDNGGDDLAVTATGPFTFKTAVGSGAAYAVTVKSQPTSPWQTCAPTSASGTVGAANVTGVQVACTTNSYQVSASVTGLAGAGLTLTLNGASPTSAATSGTFALGAKLLSGATYVVAVQAQPTNPSQTCTITAPGTVVAGNDIAVAVACTTNKYTVGGSVTGLNGSGLVLTDGSNGDTVAIPGGAKSFTFPKSIASGQTYFVTASAQPSSPTQSCSVTGGTGQVGGGAVTTITVNCQTQTYTVGGTLTVTGGGTLGAGLALTNGAETIHPTSTGSFAFTTPIASGAMYAVSVTAQPSGPTQSCAASGATGTVVNGNVNNVAITCTTTSFPVGGTVTGLAAGTTVVLEDNNGDDLTVTATGSFAFKTLVPSGGGYSATVKTQPTSPWQTCVPTANAGTVGGAAITGIQVTCTTITETVSGTVSGLTGAGLTLVLSGSALVATETLPVGVNATNFAFKSTVPSGSTYTVAAVGRPQSPSETCVVGSAGGTIQGSPVTGVTVTCTVDAFTVGGTIAGLTGAGMVLTDNTSDTLTPAVGQTSFAFGKAVASGQPYSVVIQTQPAGQSCAVSGGTTSPGSGAVGNAPVALTINCTSFYTVSGQITGLNGTGLQLSDGKDTITVVNGANSFSFPTPLVSGATFSLSVVAQPTSYWDTCTISPTGTQTISGNVSNVVVTCVPQKGTLNLTLVNNGGAAFPGLFVVAGPAATASSGTLGGGNTASGPFTIPSGSAYSVQAGPPAGLTCTVSGNVSGIMGNPATPLAVTVVCNVETFVYSLTVVNEGGANTPCSAIPISWGAAVVENVNMVAGGTTSVAVPYSKLEAATFSGASTNLCVCSTTPGPQTLCANPPCGATFLDDFAYQSYSATIYCAGVPPPG